MCTGSPETREKRAKLIQAIDEYVNQKVKDIIEEKKDNYCSECGRKNETSRTNSPL